MIVGDPKPVEEIAASIADYGHVLVLGCGSCVTVCRSGGDAEAHDLALQLSHPRYFKKALPEFVVHAIERQCERDLLEAFLNIPDGVDAILSMACGVGVQVVSDMVDPMPVVPALNTTFMGGADEPGIWREKCRGCGQCLLAYTGSICPITRCAKSPLNGPCGGTGNGNCEVDPYMPCAWAMIYYRLKRQGNLDLLKTIRTSCDWRAAGSEGPRVRKRPWIGNDVQSRS